MSLRERVQTKLDQKTKPVGSLGMLEEVAVDLCVAQGVESPRVSRVHALIFAADHGVSREGVSAFPREVTAQMVHCIVGGGSAVATLARLHDVQLDVFDVGVDADIAPAPGLHVWKVGRGTQNLRVGAAMTAQELAASLEAGARALALAHDAGARCVVIGEMGIGNTTPASALLGAQLGRAASDVTGAGTGVVGPALQAKIEVVDAAIRRVEAVKDPRTLLAELGGFEIAAMAGVCLSSVASKTAVVVDGFISSVAAYLAVCIDPAVRAQLIFSHRGDERGHQVVLEALNARPMLDMRMRLGEGSGALLAVPLLRSAVEILEKMATFDEGGVSNRA